MYLWSRCLFWALIAERDRHCYRFIFYGSVESKTHTLFMILGQKYPRIGCITVYGSTPQESEVNRSEYSGQQWIDLCMFQFLLLPSHPDTPGIYHFFFTCGVPFPTPGHKERGNSPPLRHLKTDCRFFYKIMSCVSLASNALSCVFFFKFRFYKLWQTVFLQPIA